MLARDLALEAAILADPDNLDHYRVYADWLLAQGDPRGELMAYELAPAVNDAKRNALWMAVRARVMPHISAGLPDRGLSWRHGFIDAIALDLSGSPDPVSAQLVEILGHPSAFAVGTVQLSEPSDENDERDAIAALVSAAPPTLRAVRLHFDRDVGDLAPLYRFALRELVVRHPSTSRTGDPPRRDAVSRACVRSIVAAPWQLRTLGLDFANGSATIDDLLPLFARDLPLEDLELANLRGPTGKLCRALIDSPFAHRLTRLWLRGEIARADYKLLVEHRARFASLTNVLLPSATYTRKLRGH